MSHTSSRHPSPSELHRYDQLCKAFENAWKAGDQPRLEEFLGQVPTGQRAPLLPELLKVELHYRVGRGESPAASEYRRRLPEWSDAIARAFAVEEATRLLRVHAVRPALAALAEDRPERIGPYPVVCEIGRGGMGVVLKVRDQKLHRCLAVKLLLARHRCNATLVARFNQEAEIHASLNLHGVAMVIGRDHHVDGRPYYVMALVEGETLAERLRRRTSLCDGLPRFLRAFADVCQTMAEVHRQGIIHRDLKPRNLMLGLRDRTTVMDWGLAKRLGDASGNGEAGLDGDGHLTIVDQTLAGTIVGTPAYMPPEQANGDVAAQDERADVFGLGAILCEILTGAPPYRGERGETERLAREANLADAYDRLNACGAHRVLIDLAFDCLAAPLENRPRDAGEVAGRMQQYLAQVEEAERCAQQRRERVKAEQDVQGLLGQAERLERQGDVRGALVEASKARQLAMERTRDSVCLRIDDYMHDLTMVAHLHDAARAVCERADRFGPVGQPCRAYADAFTRYGLDVIGPPPRETAHRVAASKLRRYLIAALDEWAWLSNESGLRRHLTEIAHLADPTPGGPEDLLRNALKRSDRTLLRRLAGRPGGLSCSSALVRLADGLLAHKEGCLADSVLRSAWERFGDACSACHLASLLLRRQPPGLDEARLLLEQARYTSASCPEIHLTLGRTLILLGRDDEALAAFHQVLELRRDDARALYRIGEILLSRSDPQAEDYLTRAFHTASSPLLKEIHRLLSRLGVRSLTGTRAPHERLQALVAILRPAHHSGTRSRTTGRSSSSRSNGPSALSDRATTPAERE